MNYRDSIKPIIDRVMALIGLIVLSPIFLLTIVLLAIANRGQVFFVQPRPGKDEVIFRLVKFKTMNEEKDREGQLLSDAERLTRIGKLVRKTSLDELPQLINILKGEMSFIGPRPLLVEYLPYYNAVEKMRHSVKPGITGWAQVNGRNLLSWDRKFELDIWYVMNQTCWLDLKIIFKTVLKVFVREGISAEGHATMPTFIEFVQNQRNRNEK
jgi:undecaprenyl phosphate N,N'-diacetylbacillosamine 1-phosphate transferase